MVTNIMLGIPCLAVMFCRFVFTRYAQGLITDEIKLFKKVVCVALVFFTLHWLSIFPAQHSFNGELSTEKNIMGRICSQTHIPEFLEDTVNVTVSVKPKILIITMLIIILVFNIYCYISARRQRALHNIPKHRVNLMNIQVNFLIPFQICIHGISHQLLNIPFEIFYSQLGVHNVFKIWWSYHLLMIVLIQILTPSLIIYSARREFQEFNGLKAATFPGQEKPRPLPVFPARQQVDKEMVKRMKNKNKILPKMIFRKPVLKEKNTTVPVEAHINLSALDWQCTARTPRILLNDQTLVIVDC